MMCKIQPLDMSVSKFENKKPTEKRGKEVLEIICDPVSQFPFKSRVIQILRELSEICTLPYFTCNHDVGIWEVAIG